MNEKLLQFIWQFQHFNRQDLFTTEGEEIIVIHQGTLNTNQGPDFSGAKIKAGDTIWAGSVELHVQSSQWYQHQHGADSNYNNVILHVVWKHDADNKFPFPVIELHDRVSKILLNKYDQLMQAGSAIPCEKQISSINEFVWQSWQQRLLVERLMEKSSVVFDHLHNTHNHWEETFWRMLAKNFGIKVNSQAFENIAVSIPVNVLAKHKNQVQQLEALLLGQAGILAGSFTDDYCIMLQKEYDFLKKKYGLTVVNTPVHYLRMRPSNFPSIRLAQLAMLIHQSSHLFSKILSCVSVKELKKMLDVTANDYWHYHYLPDEISSFKKKKLGTTMIENILVNTVAPVLFAYGHYQNENKYKDQAITLLEQLAAEKNNIIDVFAAAGVQVRSAFASQALIQLKNNYCDQKRCLQCAVGNSILKRG